MPTITGKAIGRKKPLFDDFSVSLPPEADDGDDGTTLRDMISHIVRTEVASFTGRQRERHLLKVLTESQIADAVVTGKVDMGGRDLEEDADTEDAVGFALQAFEDGMYLVVLDDEEKQSLDEQVYLRPDSRITFVRLTMLSGG
jgi:hypothetical protein